MKTMRRFFLVLLLACWQAGAWAAGIQYELRVDGLACPFCAYGIEKKIKNTEGVRAVRFDLERGVVVVEMAEDLCLDRAQWERLIKEAGFTLRGVTEKTLP